MTSKPRLPPLDGSVKVLPGFTDFHYTNNPERPIFQYANDSGDITKISFLEFVRATHRFAHAVRPKGSGKDNEVVAVIVACDTLLYVAAITGLARAGLVAFPISPRNSPAAIHNLLSKTNCHRLLTTSAFLQPLVDTCKVEFAARDHALQIDELPTLPQIFPKLGNEVASDPFVEYKLESEWQASWDDVAVYLHSSGSTGFPKPIPQTHKSVLHWCSFPCITETIHHPRPVIWGSMMLPTFHTLGMYIQVYAPLVTGVGVAIFPPKAPGPPMMPTPDNTLEHCKKAGATVVVAVPQYLEVWAQNPQTLKYLANMELVTFAGGPLSAKSGDLFVSNGAIINAAYGATEFGAPTHLFDVHPDNAAPHVKKDKEHWMWMRFPDTVKTKWVDQGDGTYELHMLTHDGHQLSIENLPDERGYATNDLWEPHPTVEGLWKIVGRADDVLVLSSGEKTVPAPMEGHILHHKMVEGTMMFGRGRNQVGILIEPKPEYAIDIKDEKAVIEFRNQIWSVVEEANKDAPAFSRIFKEMILITDPSRPLVRAAKGTVVRKVTLAQYAEEVDALYETVESSTKAEGVEPPASWTIPDLIGWLAEHAKQINGERDIDPEIDLFEQGFDSLSATFLRNRIIGALRLSVDPTAKDALAGVTQNIVYVNPTLKQLASAIAALITPPTADGVNGVTLDSPAKTISAMIAKYSSDFPKVSTTTGIQKEGAVVFLTGSTGSLGSYLLSTLLNDSKVKKVYAFNRKSTAGPSDKRQKEAFEDKGFPTASLSSEKVVFVDGDAVEDKFGLPGSLYDEIHASVTHIIHNAWRLDFNLSLASFEPNVRATRSLIDFALTSRSAADVRFIFTSSIAVSQSWDTSKGLFPETVITEPAVAVGNGYGEGKYVAEQLLAKASEHGLKSTSLRIGQVCGGVPKGAWATTDWVPILVKSSLALGCLPDAQGLVSWIPMDVVATTILDLAFDVKQPPLALNIVHPRPVKWATVMAAVGKALTSSVLSKPSRSLPSLTFSEWADKLEVRALQAAGDDYEKIPAIRLLQFFRTLAAADQAIRESGVEDTEAGGMANFATAETQARSASFKALKSLNETDAQRWIGYWKGKNFI